MQAAEEKVTTHLEYDASSTSYQELSSHLNSLLPNTFHALVDAQGMSLARRERVPSSGQWYWVVRTMRDLMPEVVRLWSDTQLESFLDTHQVCEEQCGKTGFHYHCNQCGGLMHTSPTADCAMCAMQAYRDLRDGTSYQETM